MRKGWPPVPQTLRKWRRKSPWHCWTALPCPHGRSSHILLLTAASSPGGLVTGLCSCWTLKSSTTHGTCSPKGWVAAFSGHCLAATCFPEHPSLNVLLSPETCLLSLWSGKHPGMVFFSNKSKCHSTPIVWSTWSNVLSFGNSTSSLFCRDQRKTETGSKWVVRPLKKPVKATKDVLSLQGKIRFNQKTTDGWSHWLRKERRQW